MTTHRTEADAVAEIAAGSTLVNGSPVETAPLILVREHGEGGSSHVAHIDLEPYQRAPSRKKGLVALTHPDSFALYVNTHKDPSSRIYASIDNVEIVAVLNDDQAGGQDSIAGWGDHIARLVVKRTLAWDRWRKLDGKLMSQADFAEHLELSLPEIISPPSANLVEIARTFTASTATAFRSAQRLDSGEIQFAYEQSINASAGRSGEVHIPTEFTIALPLFQGGDLTTLTARFRYRLNDGKLTLGYFLLNPDDAELAAFEALVDNASGATGLATMYGTPPRRR